jgi:hypothetical protein
MVGEAMVVGAMVVGDTVVGDMAVVAVAAVNHNNNNPGPRRPPILVSERRPRTLNAVPIL